VPGSRLATNVWPMQKACVLSAVREWPELRLLHRENATRAAWGGPAPRA